MPLGLLRVARLQELYREAVMGQEVVLGHLDRVGVQRAGVAPVGQLAPRAQRERRDGAGARGGQGDAARPRMREGVARPPGQRDRQADLGEIHVAVRARLHADLDQTDDRDQRDQVPQPAHEEVGARGSAKRANSSVVAGEPNARSAGEPTADEVRHRMGIEDREPVRPDTVEHVDHVGIEGVHEPQW